MTEFITQATSYIDGLSPLLRGFLLIIFCLLEYILPIFPGDTVVIATGLFKARGALSFWEIILGLGGGSLIGIIITYYVGVMLTKSEKKYSSRFISNNDINKITQWYKKWGYTLLLVNRFFPGIRSLFFVAAGMNKMPLIPVIIAGLFASLIFNSLLFILGYFAGNNLEFIENFMQQYTIVAYAIIALIISIFFIIFYLKKRKT